jgi:hypothetical protein
MKRLRRSRGAQQNPTSTQSLADRPRGCNGKQKKMGPSSSSTPNISQRRVSPMALPSLAYDSEPLDNVSEPPSSTSSSDDENPAISSSFASLPKRNDVQIATTKFSARWRNAARADAGIPREAAPNGAINPQDLMKRFSGNKAKPFLELPRELRDQIYRELYVHSSAIAIRQPKFHLPVLAHLGKPLALSRTNKQIYEEVTAIFIGENDFILDLNILTAIDFLSAMPPSVSKHFTSITLGKTIMSGYVRYELGMFDSSRLRTDLIKRLVYEWNLKTISIEVPDEHNPNVTTINGANGAVAIGGAPAAGVANNWFNLSTFHPRHDYSWSLMRELVDVLIESGFQKLRLVYNTALADTSDPKKLLNLYAVSRILYLDDEFEVETQVKRIEMARQAGRRDEFASKLEVEKYVRARRQIRQFCVGYGKRRGWENGSVIAIRKAEAVDEKERRKEGLWEVGELLKMPGAAENISREL